VYKTRRRDSTRLPPSEAPPRAVTPARVSGMIFGNRENGGGFRGGVGGRRVMAGKSAGSPVVMLVEDFQDTREMMRRMLEMSGCRVDEAANEQEDNELSQQGGIEIELMDLNMHVIYDFNASH